MSMASPQWKSYQAPVQDPAILAFQRTGNVNVNTNSSNYGNNANSSPTSNNINNSIRETGVVEKMLHSYGFIQCCDREARLFFHFSEYAGDIGDIKVNDLVEFQMSFDRRTGKPVAVNVIKLEPENNSLSYDVVIEERMTGTVVAEPKNGIDGVGRVSYESSGECFFLAFTAEDLEPGVKITSGDEVSFCIATDKSDCGVRATQITRADPSDKMNGQGDAEDLAYRSVKHSTLSPTAPKYSPINMSPTKKGLLQKNGNIKAKSMKPKTDKFQGVVCSMKDNFGFIERSDAVKEIFFHYSEYCGNINELRLGDDVEFGIQIRNNKEVATDIICLPEGTVIFEDVGVDRRRGRVQKTLKSIHGRKPSDPLAGKIVYETVNGPIEIPYGDKDQTGDYTLQTDDLVEFNIATDRRDKLQRATNITLVEDTFKVNGEKREKGVIVTLKDGYGFIKCAERDARMFFHFSELMSKKELAINDEVQFTVIQDPSNSTRQIAVRIKQLPRGSVQFDVILPDKFIGTVEKEFSAKPGENDPGIIMYDVNGTKQPISFSMRMNDRSLPKQGEKVEFQISESRNQRIRSAVNLRLLNKPATGSKLFGFIATLKENFGFIENAEHDKEVFFHFSNFDGDPSSLDLGDEVEYTLNRKTQKASAENIRRTAKGSVSPEELLAPVYDGKIIRCMRIVNPEQDEYPGLVQIGIEDDESCEVYPYGVTSLADKRDFLQKGDIVKFQLCIVKSSGTKRATNIAAKRNYIRARVDSVKGQFGFLDYEAEEGKKLFFHMTEVHNNAEIQVGDEVEFVVVQNQRNKKFSACSLRKITNYQRPERLMSRLKSVSEDSVTRVVVLRQPKGPDGTKGFSNYVRVPWKSTAK